MFYQSNIVLKTPLGRNVYSWGLGNKYIYNTSELDKKALSKGGCFLFTHQRDYGLIYWYKENEIRLGAFDGAWKDGGSIVDFFYC